jgi:ABC-type branched-subunit amino acid transport system ATPase component
MDFDRLTIWDSLLLASTDRGYEQPHRIFSERTVFEHHEDEMRRYLDHFGLGDPTGFARSAGQKKLLDIVRCLLLKPRFLLLDEPTAGLPEQQTDKVISIIRELAAAGTSVVIVEHDLNVIWSLCDEVSFMAEGSVILKGDPQTIRAHRTVIEKYLGEGHV